MWRTLIREWLLFETLFFQLSRSSFVTSRRTLTTHNINDVDLLYADVPKPCKTKSERKPYPTPMKILIRRAKEQRESRKAEPCKMLEHAPENGLLVPELVGVAHQVYRARDSLLHGLSKLVNVAIPVKRCRFCSEVHIGHVGHEIRTCTGPKSGFRSATHVWRRGGIADVVRFPHCYHLDDRVGKPRVIHKERFTVQKLPAIVELCVQAGLDLEDYPTRRRTKPVYCVEGRIVDLESGTEVESQSYAHYSLSQSRDTDEQLMCLSEVSAKTLDSWFEMRTGAMKIMEKYSVQTCGYCPEVQVGPKGHKVKACRGAKHQSRAGMHAWQEATIDDLIRPNYVWHVKDPHASSPLDNSLKRYYGKAPAIVELCVQAGASVPDEYRSMTRIDVVSPCRDEVDLVA
ncbi:hypothetical protein Sjap_004300 [Stephania japonica]|uniref:APO domain-containing protein n=1 Tax=Stephania japonica TaxID=461633 RepID=A0AAP0PHQ3_9MAGN